MPDSLAICENFSSNTAKQKGAGLALTFAKTLLHIFKDLTHNLICF